MKEIKSSYIYDKIFNYIKDENFKYKLFFYSKKFQNKINIKLVDYKEKYLEKIGFRLNRYLYSRDKFDKGFLSKKLDIILTQKKLNRKEIENIIGEILQNKKGKDLEELDINTLEEVFEETINIDSPFFEILSKTEIFEKQYTIVMYQYMIDKYNLKDDYISAFDMLNKSNAKYASLFTSFNDIMKINYLKEFKIDFNKIKRLTLVKEDNNINNDNIYFFNTFFSLDGVNNNLIYLKLYLDKECKLDSAVFENINNFKSLKYLYISYFNFNDTFTLKLTTLKLLSIEICNNLRIEEKCCLTLQRLTLSESSIKNDTLLKFPNLEYCYFYDYDNIEYKSFIDFKSLNKLKIFTGKTNDFFELDNEFLENITIINDIEYYSKDIEVKILERLINMKYLKNIKIGLNRVNNDDIGKINHKNNSVTNLELFWGNYNDKCLLNNLQQKFPNLVDFKLIIDFKGEINKREKSIIKINENKASKISKIFMKINYFNNFIQIECCPFDKLIEVDFEFKYFFNNLNNFFPLFDDKCQIVFKCLKKFKFGIKQGKKKIKNNIIENIFKNIDKMPNLKYFYLCCFSNVDKNIYMQFINKLLSLDLKSIFLFPQYSEENKSSYNKKDIEKMYDNFDFYQYDNIHIQKIN